MAVAVQPVPLTYEDYLREGEVAERYDILNGVRSFMPGPNKRHQRIAGKLLRALQDFETASGISEAIVAPMDVLIQRRPLRVRQPDLLFVTHERLAAASTESDAGVLEAAPELVVEILSDSDRQNVVDTKLADYAHIGVQEAWLVRPENGTVEVLSLTAEGMVTVAVFGMGETAHSRVFPNLRMMVTEVLTA